MEKIIIESLSEALNSQPVQKLITTLGKYQTVEHVYDGSIIYQFPKEHVEISFDENDILTKLELRIEPSQNLVLEEIIKKYAHKSEIVAHLGQPKVNQNNTILAYDLASYWMRFELKAEQTTKIVYLCSSSVGLSYKQPNKVMRTCKGSGKP